MIRRAVALALLTGLLLVPLFSSAQDEITTLVVTLYDPRTNDSMIAQVMTDGREADVVGQYTTTAADGTTIHASPSFSPDGTLLLYTATPPESRPQIYTQSVATGLITKLTNAPTTYYYDVRWSPNGKHIAYAAALPSEYEDIYVMDADGENITRLTQTPNLSEVAVAWSPDGLTLAFVQRDADLNATLYTVPITGGAPVPVGNPARSGFAPVWSPDGTRIYYAARDLDAYTASLVSIAPDGSDEQVLYTLSGTDENSPSIGSIAVAPDGRTIAFINSNFVVTDEGFVITSALNLLDIETGEVQTPQWIIDDLWAGELAFVPQSD